MLLFSIQSKLRACNRRLFVPREGCGIWDIDKVSLGKERRSEVAAWSCVGCSLLKGAFHIVELMDQAFILAVSQQ